MWTSTPVPAPVLSLSLQFPLSSGFTGGALPLLPRCALRPWSQTAGVGVRADVVAVAVPEPLYTRPLGPCGVGGGRGVRPHGTPVCAPAHDANALGPVCACAPARQTTDTQRFLRRFTGPLQFVPDHHFGPGGKGTPPCPAQTSAPRRSTTVFPVSRICNRQRRMRRLQHHLLSRGFCAVSCTSARSPADTTLSGPLFCP